MNTAPQRAWGAECYLGHGENPQKERTKDLKSALWNNNITELHYVKF